jgi:hypothetical protein
MYVSFSSLWPNTWDNNLREKGFIWAQRFQPSKVGRVWWSRVAHITVATKQREKMTMLVGFLLPLWFHQGLHPMGWCHPYSRYEFLLNPLWKCLHRHTQRCALLISYTFLIQWSWQSRLIITLCIGKDIVCIGFSTIWSLKQLLEVLEHILHG